MAYFNHRHIRMAVDDKELFANSVTVNVENSLEPRYVSNQRHSDGYYPTDGIKGSMSISYFLTGYDPLKQYITIENTPLRVKLPGGDMSTMSDPDFAVSGYLSNYSLSIKPNSPIIANCNILFFEEISGLRDQSSASYIKPYVLSSSDVEVDVLSNYSSETIQGVESVDFEFSSEIIPHYEVRTGVLPGDFFPSYNIRPNRVSFGAKTIRATVYCDWLSTENPSLPVTGKDMGIKINFRHPTAQNFTESFTCSGTLTSRNIRGSLGDYYRTALTIVQNNVDSTPIISGFDPFSSSPGSFIKISGLNFSNTTSVTFEDREALRYTVVSDKLISGIVPYDAITGTIYVNTYGGRAQSSNVYQLSYPAMSINYVSPYTGLSGQSVYISGNNFYRISHVFFSGKSGSFYNINSGTIQAYIPSYAESGLIKVVSTGRKIFANSPHGYVPTPFISGVHQWTGMSGDNMYISGFGFNGINICRFNGINASRFDVVNNILLTGTVPSGNVKGYIYLQGVSGVNCYSPIKFSPSLFISGIDPLSGTAGDIVRISGYNFQSGILYAYSGAGNFKIKYGTAIGRVALNSNRLMTGILPSDFTTGPIYIYDPDDSIYTNTGYFTLKYQQPTITSFGPTYAVSGYRYDGYVKGTNFFNVTGVDFRGYTTANSSRVHLIPQSNLRSDVLGTRINIVNYTGLILPTGTSADPYAPTGDFQLFVLTTQYSASLATATSKLRVEKLVEPL